MAVLYSVYLLLKEKGESIEEIIKYFRNISWNTRLILVLLLIPVNWAFEAWKWQRLAIKVERISFWQAYQGVLAGLALANFTPIMIGDYAGKILMLKTRERTTSIGAILLGNSIQLYVSLLVGVISYIYFLRVSGPAPLLLHTGIIIFLSILLLFGVWLAFNVQKTSSIRINHQFLNSIMRYLIILKDYTITDIREIFLLATGRYIIFTIQFVLVLRLFQVNLPLEILLAGVGIIFLTKSVGAAFNFLGDLSMRTITSVYYFGYFGVKLSRITTATFTIWLINVLVPVMIGSLFILALRFSTRNLKASAE